MNMKIEKIKYVDQGKDKEETPEKVSYIAFKQHFFATILLTDTPFETSKLHSKKLVKMKITIRFLPNNLKQMCLWLSQMAK